MSIKYNNVVYDMKAAGRKVTVMSLGEAFFDIPLFPFTELPSPDIYHYSHSRGIPQLRKKLSDYFLWEYGVQFAPETEIIIAAGSKAAIYMALLSVLDPGDEVLYAEPAWVSYPEQIKLCHGVPLGIPKPDMDRGFGPHITKRTKAIVITNPHNPIGYVYREDELLDLLDLAREHDIWILSDEVYSDFVIDGSFISLAKLDSTKRHAIVFNSMSKNLGMSGWRLGFVIANADVIDQVLKVNQHLITCPATILQHYLVHYHDSILEITKPQIVEVVRHRQLLARYMDDIGLHHMPGSATFYLFVSIGPSRLGSEAFCTRLLEQYAVSVVPGVGYGASCDSFVRVSVGTGSLDEHKRGLDHLKELIDRTS